MNDTIKEKISTLELQINSNEAYEAVITFIDNLSPLLKTDISIKEKSEYHWRSTPYKGMKDSKILKD